MQNICFEFSGNKGERLDKFLTESFSLMSGFEYLTRSQIVNLIQGGVVKINGKVIKKSGYPLKPGILIELSIDQADSKEIEPFDFKISILFEDDDLIVIDKPDGISMHPGAGRNKTGTIINALSDKLKNISDSSLSSQGKGPFRPGIVHRLDKDTTGVVVLAKNVLTHQKLSEQFAARSVSRKYLALVLLSPRASRAPRVSDQGRIEARVGRHATQPTKMSVLESGGRVAATNWSVLERMRYGALLELKLETGRTHQIRVHLESIGCPVIGDKTYGDFSLLPKSLKFAADSFGRQALHAASLAFIHPSNGRELTFLSQIPDDFKRLLNEFRNYK